jgi:hypothetical protein
MVPDGKAVNESGIHTGRIMHPVLRQDPLRGIFNCTIMHMGPLKTTGHKIHFQACFGIIGDIHDKLGSQFNDMVIGCSGNFRLVPSQQGSFPVPLGGMFTQGVDGVFLYDLGETMQCQGQSQG